MRNVLRGAVAWLLGLGLLVWLALSGCGLLKAAPPRVERFDCQVRALEPLVGDVLDARKLVEDLYAGRASLTSVLANIDATRAELVKLQDDLAACEPPPPAAPVGEPS